MPSTATSPSATLPRRQFESGMQDRSIDVAKAQADKRLAQVELHKADLDGNGKINGPEEMQALYGVVDALDRNGSASSLRVATRSGATTAGSAALALSEHADARGLASRLRRGVGDATRGDQTSPVAMPTPQVAEAAKALIASAGKNYGVPNPWVNTDPAHAAPVDRPLDGTAGKWKCNLFGGNALAKAGFEAPKYGNGAKGEYPNANQWHKWSDEYAPELGNKVHFQLRGELDPAQFAAGPDREAAIARFLKQAKPGDVVTVDHAGTTVADGGHVRVVVGNDIKLARGPDGKIQVSGALNSAQARQHAATEQRDAPSAFAGEERIWILRPTRPIEQGASVGNS